MFRERHSPKFKFMFRERHPPNNLFDRRAVTISWNLSVHPRRKGDIYSVTVNVRLPLWMFAFEIWCMLAISVMNVGSSKSSTKILHTGFWWADVHDTRSCHPSNFETPTLHSSRWTLILHRNIAKTFIDIWHAHVSRSWLPSQISMYQFMVTALTKPYCMLTNQAHTCQEMWYLPQRFKTPRVLRPKSCRLP